MNKLKDMERERARLGFYIVKEIIKQDNETAKKFKTHIKNIPMYIYANGLIATLAFILKKSNQNNSNKLNLEEKSYNYISKILVDYFEQYTILKKIEVQEQKLENLIQEIINLSSEKEYRQYTLEVLFFLEWAVKFSEGMIGNE
ncbi:type III-B CRISPR module-associated protein Cmr5 [Iocasia frigidifontis]|uniref:CRISPR type III-B/RAMP module-associated protein Cmr5 n=1 Tax=Iocasia fonsfrigidae TaxID=2682810 RepID=A0A8A7KHY7_9FIRM|nr:type III-B CRISPR module-associated protein Cmr5 [Iocasia fonsfrigidae]QTL97492.1 type III-B CRISPR module-associated protein Cmr5 [Iocasia fonsfrigidae]